MKLRETRIVHNKSSSVDNYMPEIKTSFLGWESFFEAGYGRFYEGASYAGLNFYTIGWAKKIIDLYIDECKREDEHEKSLKTVYIKYP